ncbi:16S rRNA m(2)G 1207 methyltransferase [Izhakiella capsodis]|uniref:Ribosomal RNA small subunit methyltransferase C n=1 Tax=Izhakiella capsodis TaxID=1367852 RepID=A0A1I4X0U9_9GAMM|nr:16S rRNA (guanine(1207)-N(2))-methyltransferase RsmC [Izhakiella capsodis]SFN19242.1 16S rRNA m(2)G 1207 methyltransferase [Izhakiella capsodis]
MSAYTPASEVILRHSDEFTERRVLFAGDLQDSLPGELNTALSKAYSQQYHHWQALNRLMGERAHYGLTADAQTTADCDTLVYYWPKNKPEASYQLQNLLSLLPAGSDVFIVGENRSGVRSAEHMFSDFGSLSKIDSARRCGLYHGRLETQATFDADAWWNCYMLNGLTIKTLPGVFSRDGLDAGSALLLSTLQPHTKGKVLDVGCGAGVLSAVLASHSPKVRLWLCDASATAISASQATLAANNFDGEVFASNVFSEVTARFDLILSNPPFHEGTQTSLDAAQALIRGSVKHLNSGGELRIVANAFLPYAQILDEVFGQHQVLAQTGRFKVYSAIYGHTARR